MERITGRVVNHEGNKHNSIITDLVEFLLHPPVPTLCISNKNQIATFHVILYYNLGKNKMTEFTITKLLTYIIRIGLHFEEHRQALSVTVGSKETSSSRLEIDEHRTKFDK